MGGRPHPGSGATAPLQPRRLHSLLAGCLKAATWPIQALEGAVVLLPLGSLEDHPGGAPASLDTLLALAASCAAAEDTGWLLAPPLGYGLSPSHTAWVGPRSGRLLEEALVEAVAGLYRLGARHVAIVDGHEGHRGVAERAAARSGASHHSLWSHLARAAGVDLLDWGRLYRLEEEIAARLREGLLHPAIAKAVEALRREIEEAAMGLGEVSARHGPRRGSAEVHRAHRV